MTETTAEALREEYLARLDEAMRGLPHGVASDIRDGIQEELLGLDAAATAARIARLGDPGVIAREAQEELPAPPPRADSAPAAVSGSRPSVTATKGFAIAAGLTLSFGGFLLPVVGWLVGAVLVSLSSLWKTWEKAVAIVVPFVFTGLSYLIVSTFTGFGGGESSGTSSGTGTPPAVGGDNPLVPGLGEWHLLVLLGLLLVPASGLWLLWRLRGREAR